MKLSVLLHHTQIRDTHAAHRAGAGEERQSQRRE